jgi:hypothetical protein
MSLPARLSGAEGSAAALYTDLADLQGSPSVQAMQEGTGAVLMGRPTFGIVVGAGLRLFDGTPPVAWRSSASTTSARTSLRGRYCRRAEPAPSEQRPEALEDGRRTLGVLHHPPVPAAVEHLDPGTGAGRGAAPLGVGADEGIL